MPARAALEPVRRLAEDLLPGARARLLPADDTPPAGLAVALTRADGRPLAWLVLDPPSPPADPSPVMAALGRLADVARQMAPLAGEAAHQEGLASLVRAIPIRAVMTDRQMRLMAISETAAADLQTSQPEVLGQRLHDLAPDIFARFPALHDRVMAGETLRTPRLEWRDADGKTRWYRSEVTPWRDTDGQVAGAMTFAVEITDVVDALEASRRAAERLSLAAGLAGVHIWDADFVTSEVVTAGAFDSFFDGSFGYPEMFRDPSITIHPEDRARIFPDWAKAALADEPSRAEHRINRSDDREVWAASTVKVIRDAEGRLLRIVGAMQDITERRRTEAALRDAVGAAEAANSAKSLFLATMSHEIRTPLNGVLGMAQAMAADELSAAQRSRLRTIRHSGEALLAILNDLLDLSKIEAGKLELEIVDFDLGRLVEEVHDAFEGAAARKGLRLAMEVAPRARGRYRGEATRLRQILFNLMANAVKFTEAGEVLLSVEARVDGLAFAVADTGIGIPADRLPYLFDKFEQADASTTRRFGGTGLGLAICRELATLMGGRVDAESREGAGSTFELTLALPRIGDEIERPRGVEPATIQFGPEASLRVLAAEDNSVNQLVLRTLLQQAGLDPMIVADGQAALDAWREQPWDVVLMDVQMPIMDGPTATRAIRAEEAASGRARTPILALTANAMSHQVEEYAAAGMDGLIAKPIRVDDLFGALHAVLDQPCGEAVAQSML